MRKGLDNLPLYESFNLIHDTSVLFCIIADLEFCP
uniref:Uncharacterized protein n=1 Tax=Rhizophora mucronata TaxID=61149 RepID=A0A2P2QAK4_RHIMU